MLEDNEDMYEIDDNIEDDEDNENEVNEIENYHQFNEYNNGNLIENKISAIIPKEIIKEKDPKFDSFKKIDSGIEADLINEINNKKDVSFKTDTLLKNELNTGKINRLNMKNLTENLKNNKEKLNSSKKSKNQHQVKNTKNLKLNKVELVNLEDENKKTIESKKSLVNSLEIKNESSHLSTSKKHENSTERLNPNKNATANNTFSTANFKNKKTNVEKKKKTKQSPKKPKDNLNNIDNVKRKNNTTNEKKILNIPTYKEVLEKQKQSINPNLSNLAKSKLEIENLRLSSNQIVDENVFCYISEDKGDQYEDNSIVTKGERIYMKNMAEKNLKLIMEERERKLKINENIDASTFKPSLQLTSYYNPKNYDSKNHLNLTTCIKNKNINERQNKDDTYDLNIEDEIELMKNEKKVAKWSDIEKYTEKLYKDHERKQFIRKKQTDEYYNEMCKQYVNPHSNLVPNNTFFERLQDWIIKQKEKEDERRELRKLNLSNNQELFKPLVKPNNYSFKQERPKNGKELLNKLHSDYRETLEKRKKLFEGGIINSKKESERVERLCSPQSRELNEKTKQELFTKIFDILDYNQDKKISYDEDFSEMLSNIPKNIQKILEPLFEEFKENKEVLTLKEFIVSCGRLYKILQYWERTELFNYIFSIKKETSSKHQRHLNDIKILDSEIKEKPQINTEEAKSYLDNSKKYAGLNFMERNKLSIENIKKTKEKGINDKTLRDKKGKTLFYI